MMDPVFCFTVSSRLWLGYDFEWRVQTGRSFDIPTGFSDSWWPARSCSRTQSRNTEKCCGADQRAAGCLGVTAVYRDGSNCVCPLRTGLIRHGRHLVRFVSPIGFC
jgi:hypothetical protein